MYSGMANGASRAEVMSNSKKKNQARLSPNKLSDQLEAPSKSHYGILKKII